jgi:hypothetical protein
VEPVGGLGEQANFVTLNDGSGTTITLMVLDRNRIFEIGAQNSPNPNIKAAIVQTMRASLKKF